MSAVSEYYRYTRYVIRHKWFVFLNGLMVGVPLRQLIIHDWSKLLPCEFFPYARFFYRKYGYQNHADIPFGLRHFTINTKQDAKVKFDAAWLHHQHVNKHHWQHWVLRNDNGDTRVLNMPENCIREMVADWMGAGRALGKPDTKAWYLKNRDLMLLSVRTQKRVEALLNVESEEK